MIEAQRAETPAQEAMLQAKKAKISALRADLSAQLVTISAIRAIIKECQVEYCLMVKVGLTLMFIG